VCKAFFRLIAAIFVALFLGRFALPAFASEQDQMNMPGQSQPMGQSEPPEHSQSGQSQPMLDMSGDNSMSGMRSHSLLDAILQHSISGTDVEPTSTPSSMLMTVKGGWTLMFHGEGFLSDTQQSGPRGSGKLFSTNW
jgi:hypothetical protein